jgi:hypothetical protein
MNATLRSFSQTLAQVAPSFGARIGHRGVLVAGLCALAMSSPVAAQPIQVDLTRGERLISAQPLQDQSSSQDAPGMSEQAARNVGRVVGGVLGFAAARAAEAGSAMTAILSVGGVFAGDQVAKAMNAPRTEASRSGGADGPIAGRLDPVVRAALVPPGPSGKRMALPADTADRMTSLVVDTLAHRLLAQQAWKEYSQANVQAAVRPGDVAHLRARDALADRLKELARRNNESFYWFRNAVGALQDHGYNVEPYLALNRVLSQRIDHKGMVELDHPAVHERAQGISSLFVPLQTLADVQAPVEARRVSDSVGAP